MIYKEDTGFVNFPYQSPNLKVVDSGKTLVYLVAFDMINTHSTKSDQNINLFMPGIFVSDDVVQRPEFLKTQLSIDQLIDDQKQNDLYDSLYFPHIKSSDDLKRIMSIPITSCVCIGWSDHTLEIKDEIKFWYASFRDLTNEGKKLYYSFKKLHSNKEVRILTFNNI